MTDPFIKRTCLKRGVRSLLLHFIVALLSTTLSVAAHAETEVTLFNSAGKAEAYIAIDETIYLWSGKPVAYLENDRSGGYHVYGFNGKHLGWFVKGVVRDHEGKSACAVKEVLGTTQYEPHKSYKQYKPHKSYKQYAPYRPYFSKSLSETPCRFLLGEGAKQ